MSTYISSGSSAITKLLETITLPEPYPITELRRALRDGCETPKKELPSKLASVLKAREASRKEAMKLRSNDNDSIGSDAFDAIESQFRNEYENVVMSHANAVAANIRESFESSRTYFVYSILTATLVLLAKARKGSLHKYEDYLTQIESRCRAFHILCDELLREYWRLDDFSNVSYVFAHKHKESIPSARNTIETLQSSLCMVCECLAVCKHYQGENKGVPRSDLEKMKSDLIEQQRSIKSLELVTV